MRPAVGGVGFWLFGIQNAAFWGFIMIILALNISLMTPPVGACLFVLATVTGEKIEAITRYLWPFILAEFAVLLLVAFWPDLTLFIPRLLGF